MPETLSKQASDLIWLSGGRDFKWRDCPLVDYVDVKGITHLLHEHSQGILYLGRLQEDQSWKHKLDILNFHLAAFGTPKEIRPASRLEYAAKANVRKCLGLYYDALSHVDIHLQKQAPTPYLIEEKRYSPHVFDRSFKRRYTEKVGPPLPGPEVFSLNKTVARLNDEASKNGSFSEFAGNLAHILVEFHTSKEQVFNVIRDHDNHGRVRWLFLEESARRWKDEPGFRQLLLDLLGETDDLWLLVGVVAQLRQTPPAEHREAMRQGLNAWLKKAQTEETSYRDRYGNSFQSTVGFSALGDSLLAFGSLAEADDIPLLAEFVLKDRELKPQANAYNALARTIRRHHGTDAASQFFDSNAAELRPRGRSLAKSQRSSRNNGILLLSWIDLVVARLGPETEWAVALAEEMPPEGRSVRVRMKDAWSALERRGSMDWLSEREPDFKQWLERLERVVPARRRTGGLQTKYAG
jgi:hypothetical protein